MNILNNNSFFYQIYLRNFSFSKFICTIKNIIEVRYELKRYVVLLILLIIVLKKFLRFLNLTN